MSPRTGVFVSKSTLFHASLAHLSPEIQTLDTIISTAYCTPNVRPPTLPTELLLLIRGWSFLTVTTHLIQQSTTALERYERSLCELLCADCVAYNLDIYGPDIWQWEQFSGACACTQEDKMEDPHLHTNPGLHGQQGRYYSKEPANTAILNPKQFVDAEHWLEFYLSREVIPFADLRVGRHGHRVGLDAASTSGSQPPPELIGDIWDVVDFVLREHNCEATREPEDSRAHMHAHNRIHFGRGQFHTKRDLVQVIPLQSHVSCPSRRNEPEHAFDDDTRTKEEDLNWRAQVILRRVARDLPLLHDFQDFCNTRSGRHCVPIITRRLRWPSVTTTCYSCRDASALFHFFLQGLASLAAISISLPLAFFTVALTVLCFYSRPRSFRIL
ncbi:hypothetical protein CPC08DRAFT_813998 [Agrocybe pediades]|nr:hypothetical protein CPC08DRAFT_813998 [Agrocybe pediades]